MPILGGSSDKTADILKVVKNEGDNLTITASNIQFNRYDGMFERITVLADNTLADTTERTIGEGVPINSNEITRVASLRTISIASTSANDTSGGTGARTILLFGNDVNNLEVVDTVTMNGQTEVDSSIQFLKINEIIVVSSGSGSKNEGIVYVSDDTDTFIGGVPQNRIYIILDAGHSLSKVGNFSFGFGSKAKILVKRIIINTDATESKPVIIRFYRTINELSNGEVELLLGTFYLATVFVGDFSIDRFLQGNDEIRITAQTGVGTVKVSVKIQCYVLK